MGLTGLAMTYRSGAPVGLQVVVDGSYVVACVAGCFAALAACLRFATMRSRILDDLASNAFGMYLLHYPFVVWLQYALLGVALFAVGKAMIVFGGTLLLGWVATVAMRLVPFGSRLIGAERLVLWDAPLFQGNRAGRAPGSLVLERRHRGDDREFPPANLAR
jgi:peptidoglycan/LPS O-acetylase OafA/YrhL